MERDSRWGKIPKILISSEPFVLELGVAKFFKNNWLYILGATLVLVLFSFRLYHLTILPVFADEAIYIRWAQVMKAEETLRFLPLSDGKEPLFMWIIIPFLKFINDPLFAGRLVSVLSGFGTLIGVSFLSHLLFKSKRASVVAAILYSLSPYSLFFDRMALADSMLTMFGVWTFIFSYLAVVNERLDFAMLAGFALGGAWLTKSPALFFALLLPILWIFVKSGKSFLKVIPLTFVTLVIGYAMFNILRLGPNFHLIASRNTDYVYPLSHFIDRPLDPLKVFLIMSWEWIIAIGPWALIILGMLGYYINFKKHWKKLLILSIWFLGPIFVQAEFAKVFTARYILFSIPFLMIIAASSFTHERKNWLKILTFALAFFVAQSLVFDRALLINPEKAKLPRSERSGYLEEWTAGQGIYEVSQHIRNEQINHPLEKIVVGTEGYFGTLPDGLQTYLNDLMQVTIIGVGLNLTKIPDQLINSQKAGNKTYLVINSDRFKGDPNKLGLELIASYPKAVRPDRTHQSLLFFRLIKP